MGVSASLMRSPPGFKKLRHYLERHVLDFLLSIIKRRGFGSKTEFWADNLESGL